jgi:DNA-3-methyladenine glycosylase II
MNYLQHLQKDEKLAAILPADPLSLSLHSNIAFRLMISIMSQQLNIKVAAILKQRFLNLFDGRHPSPAEVLEIRYEQLRSIGLSHAKATYLHHVAAFCVEHAVTDEMLLAMNNDEVIEFITQIKGVGRWTAEMLLMFTLGREDVFPVDDLGIQTAMLAIYKPRYSNKKELHKKLQRIAQKWSPYRTYACMHLWQWKDQD